MPTDDLVELRHARLAFGDRVLWDDLDLTVRAGEFIAVLGPNGTGKTSLLKVLLGEVPLSAGTVRIAGEPVTTGSQQIGLRAPAAVDGPRVVPACLRSGRPRLRRAPLGFAGWGPAARRAKRDAVRQALAQVNGTGLAHAPVGVMSGGELQRVRVAQALVTDPVLLLCDEPLLNLDPANAGLVSALIDRRRRDAGTAVLFVTHEVDPVLPYVDRVIYLVDGRFRVGTVAEVMTSATLSELYGAEIEVLQVGGRYIVVGEHSQYQHDHCESTGHTHE
ncbi:metal ABC transporter ATP-binding protein [Mycobacterium rufum]|uniref:Metal ABC transporter ATP-binding protein n=1 Tax=Mycolicibacterium rufum TaxID=318424 RepID=A0A9X3BQE1_9MYCO|nr:metal ABC transporter ATP-binding protein [Mycolicibacterium rufum]